MEYVGTDTSLGKKEFVKSQIIIITEQNNLRSQQASELRSSGNALSRSQSRFKYPLNKSHTFMDFGKGGFPMARSEFIAPWSKDGPNDPTNDVPMKSS
jgi:hypothetical protein